jgi:hypothetical protein
MRGISIGARCARIGLVCMALAALGGCGTYVPTHQEAGGDGVGADLENAIVQSVHCELRNAVIDSFVEDRQNGRHFADFMEGWAVQVLLTLTVEEKTTVSPSVGMTFMPSLFTLGWGGTVSTDSQRLDKFNYYYTVSDLLKSDKCAKDFAVKQSEQAGSGSLLIRNDLKTREWLKSILTTKRTNVPGAKDQLGAANNAFSHDVQFIVDTSFSVNPGAKFATVTLMPAGTFLMLDRKRTHDVSFTFGPASADDKSKQQLSLTAQQLFLSNQISSAITSSIQRLQISP